MDRSEIDSLKADLRRMQARVDELEATAEEPTSRRNMIRGLGAAAAGAAVGGLAFARPAAAVDGADIMIGNATQTAESPTMLVTGTTSWSASPFVSGFTVTDDPALSSLNAVFSCIGAYADSTGPGADHNIAYWGSSKNGIGAKLDGVVPLKLTSSETALTQSSGTPGEFKVIPNAADADDKDLYFCVEDSGGHRWRKLAGPASAGAFHAVTPFRAYDSRLVNPVGGVGAISVGTNRIVSVKDKRSNADGTVVLADAVPAGATAVSANVTITTTVGSFGYLAINPGDDLVEGASAINWSATGQNLANGIIVKLDTLRQINVICGGAAGNSTQFIIDITGFFL